MVEFLYELKLKDSDKVFIKGKSPGVIVYQTVKFDVSNNEVANPMFIKALLDEEDKFIKKHIKVIITQIRNIH